MAQEISDLSKQIWSLTADLQPSKIILSNELHKARVTIASALSSEGSLILPSISSVSKRYVELTYTDKQKLDEAINQSSGELLENAAYMITRREMPHVLSGHKSLAPDAVAGQAIDMSLGPFVNQLGRPVWIDFYKIIRQFKLVRAVGGTPFLTIPVESQLGGDDIYKLASGSVWIALQQLASNAPASGYTGLRIRGGSLKFSRPLRNFGLEIVVPSTVTCTLTLELNAGLPPEGVGAGQDARLSDVQLPAKATFVFANANTHVEFVSDASLSIYGFSLDIKMIQGVGTFDPMLRQILYHAQTDSSAYKIIDVRSDQFIPAGSTDIQHTAWALPVAVTSSASLGSAAGVGSLAVFLQSGLTIAWKGQEHPTPAGSSVMLAAPGLITMVALQALGFGIKQGIPLWSGKSGNTLGSQLTLGLKSEFAVWFFASSSGYETLAMSGAIDGVFDRPITVVGRKVYIHSNLALIVFVESAIFTGIIAEAVLQPPPNIRPNDSLAFSISNAVFNTTQAISLILVAAFDGTQAKVGGLAIGFGLRNLLPILPDPYAANFGIPVSQFKYNEVVGQLIAVVLWGIGSGPILTYELPAMATSSLPNTKTTDAKKTLLIDSAVSNGFEGVVLLDLSTNVDQFGIAWETTSRKHVEISEKLTVESMFLNSSSDSVYILTTPAVLWEPVYTEPPPVPPYPVGYPSPISFPNSGGPTVSFPIFRCS